MEQHDTQLLKGVLTLVILRLLSEGESYGYQLVGDIRSLGLESLPEGTIYPALSRLEREGLIASRLVPSELGPARKYYATTRTGREVLERRTRAWQRLVAAFDPLLRSPVGTMTPAEPTLALRPSVRLAVRGGKDDD